MAALDPALFELSPARDARFSVCDVHAEMDEYPEDHPEHLREFLHRQMAEEVEGMEVCARSLVDFPDAPWELRMQMARQIADEARHVAMFRRSYEARGGVVGQYKVLAFQYRMLCKIDTLAGRLAVQNRGFEASGIDAIEDGLARFRAEAAEDLVELFDTQLADEIQHVRYANAWIPKLVALAGPSEMMRVARALDQAARAFAAVAGSAIQHYPVAEGVRREAGFTEAEIALARRHGEVAP